MVPAFPLQPDSLQTSPSPLRVLLAQNDSPSPPSLHAALGRKGFQVVAKNTIREALICLSNEEFAALICDLHLPAAGDGFTLVNAMRHVHPAAITMIISDYPALKESLAELLPQADEVLVAPVLTQDIVKLLENRLRAPKHHPIRPREPIAVILRLHSEATIREWFRRAKHSEVLQSVADMTNDARTGYLRALLDELVHRLQKPRLEEGKAQYSRAAVAHGKVRMQQGYTAAMLVEESRILQVCIFQTLRNNLNAVDLALVLTDVMTIADEVDSQLRQTMDGFAELAHASRAM